ncbi:MAG: FAD-dependent oxidoreductase [Clostridiaceae bacterium]
MEKKLELPKDMESLWLDSTTLPSFPPLNEDISTDILIVGGGITGITAAYLLSTSSYKVTLIEGSTLLQGTTGYTTAKITCQHGIIYDELINHFGEDKAALYYKSNQEAAEFIKNIIKKEGINCDYSEERAYVYTLEESYVKTLEKEFKAYEALNIPDIKYHSSLPLPLPVKAAVSIGGQGQFNPAKYLEHLIKKAKENNVTFYEHTRAQDMDADDGIYINTEKGPRIKAKKVIIASHFPFYDKKGMYFARMHPERSYIIALKPKNPFPGGMYINAETPSRSLRGAQYNNENILLVGGEGHKTGQKDFTPGCYLNLREFAEETYGIEEILYRWSAQDLVTLDKVPYIGHLTNDTPNIFVATGFRKWGMTNGTSAAHILRDLVLEIENPYEGLYTPRRFKADPSIKEGINQNSNVAKEFIKGKVKNYPDNYSDLKNEEGRIVSYKGKRAGVYKDKVGKLYMVDTTCTHMKCELNWNSAESTWDCPCHGSRFTYKGEIIEGPATRPLEIIKTEED